MAATVNGGDDRPAATLQRAEGGLQAQERSLRLYGTVSNSQGGKRQREKPYGVSNLQPCIWVHKRT